MSLYIGKDNNSNPLVHLTSDTTNISTIANGSILGNTLFNSNQSIMYVTNIETITPTVVSSSVYDYSIQWSGSSTSLQSFYLIEEWPLHNPLYGTALCGPSQSQYTVTGLPADTLLPAVNGSVHSVNLFRSATNPCGFIFYFSLTAQGYLKFGIVPDEYNSTSPASLINNVTVKKVYYQTFTNYGGSIEIGNNKFKIGSMDFKNLQMLSITTSPNGYDYKAKLGKDTYIQFLNEYSVNNNFDGMAINNSGVLGHLAGNAVYPLINATTRPKFSYSSNVPYSVVLNNHATTSATRHYLITLSSHTYTAAAVSISYYYSVNGTTRYSFMWVPVDRSTPLTFATGLTIPQGGTAPGMSIEPVSNTQLKINAASVTGHYGIASVTAISIIY